MTQLAREVKVVNEMLRVNKIKNVGERLETLALFHAIAEAGRDLNKDSPPGLRNLWMCFKTDIIDGEDHTAILLRLKTDGPLQDRNLFHPPVSRRECMLSYVQLFNSEKLTSETSLLDCTTEQQMLAFARQVMAERDELAKIILENNTRLEALSTGTISDLLELVQSNGPENNKKNVVQFMSQLCPSESVCVVDQAGIIAPLIMRDGTISPGTPPEWLGGMMVRKSGRTISYGNNKYQKLVDKTTYRRSNKSETKHLKIEARRLRQEANAARRGFSDINKERSYDRD